MQFTAPVLVNLLDGSVQSLPAPRHENGGTVFADLPLLDFPLVVAERSEVSLSATRSTPVDDAAASVRL